ncbi:hypothetical protein ACWEQ1_24160 [Streptomyces nodosus]
MRQAPRVGGEDPRACSSAAMRSGAPPRTWATCSCRDCLGWGWFDRPRCKACWGFVAKATSRRCDICHRDVAAIDGVCQLCRRQAGLIAGPDDKMRVDLTVAAQTGHQLFIIGTVRPRGGPPPRLAPPEPISVSLHSVPPRRTELTLFDMPRALHGVSSKLPLLDPELAAFLIGWAARIGELRGWPSRAIGSVSRGIRILCAVHRPGEQIRASTTAQLTHTAVPANHVLEVFENLEIFLDDRADSLDRWCRKRFAFLPPDIRAELDTWIGLLRHGTSRRRPRARSTVVTLLRLVLPFLTEYGGKYTTLRQVTRDDLTTWLTNRYHRAYEASALRSLFGTLKAERLIFSNPMHGIKGGRIPTTIPASLTTEEVEEIAQAALQDPDLRVVVALSGIHALAALQIRTLLLDQVDLAECRLDPESLNRPLDEYTAKAITDYLDHRRGRWPDSTNPHLLISRNTATTTTAVGAFWLGKLVKLLPVGLDRLRQDRIRSTSWNARSQRPARSGSGLTLCPSPPHAD